MMSSKRSDMIQIRPYFPDIFLNPALSNRYTTKGVGVSGSSSGSPLGSFRGSVRVRLGYSCGQPKSTNLGIEFWWSILLKETFGNRRNSLYLIQFIDLHGQISQFLNFMIFTLKIWRVPKKSPKIPKKTFLNRTRVSRSETDKKKKTFHLFSLVKKSLIFTMPGGRPRKKNKNTSGLKQKQTLPSISMFDEGSHVDRSREPSPDDRDLTRKDSECMATKRRAAIAKEIQRARHSRFCVHQYSNRSACSFGRRWECHP
jgi:hypothetical protein